MSVIELYFDGACEPKNPGGVATGGWVIRLDGETIFNGYKEFRRGDGATNNVAEWCALGCGLRTLLDNRELLPPATLEIYGDSQLVVNQLNREWACKKEHLQLLRQRCDDILRELDIPWTADWIPRAENEEADALSRRAYEESTGRQFPERQKVHGRD